MVETYVHEKNTEEETFLMSVLKNAIADAIRMAKQNVSADMRVGCFIVVERKGKPKINIAHVLVENGKIPPEAQKRIIQEQARAITFATNPNQSQAG